MMEYPPKKENPFITLTRAKQQKDAALFRISQAEHQIPTKTENEFLQRSMKNVLNCLSLAKGCSSSTIFCPSSCQSPSNPLPYFTVELADSMKGIIFLLAPNTFQIEIACDDLPATVIVYPEPYYPIRLYSSLPEGVNITGNHILLTPEITCPSFYIVATALQNETAVSATLNFILS